LDGQEQFFAFISYGDYQGTSMISAPACVRMFGSHFGVQCRLNSFRRTGSTSARTNFDGSLKWRYGGAQLYVHGHF